MTTVIDERVVEMRFNNADFEKNVAQSMDTLDKLKKSLNFDTAKSLENLGKATKGIKLNGLTETITEATTKFSALEIAGVTAIANITNRAVNMGIRFAKAMSIDQVAAGFEKFSEKTSSVQTIMAATEKEFTDTAVQMKTVNEQLYKLNWFTDETSYNFMDMVNNIGKFTSNGIKLEDSVTAMTGIANWAAKSGANIQEASRAMYNLSQAIGAGSMKVVDWKSIENANMATREFKELVIETAVEEGTLQKKAEGVYETLQKHEFTTAQFREQLKDDWMTSDVIIKSLAKYGQFTEDLYAAVEMYDHRLSATDLLDYIEDCKNGTLDVSKAAAELNVNESVLRKTIEDLADPVNEFGYKAFKAGQEVKTFGDVVNAVKDAVSSSWMKIFEKMFGDLEQAKAFWGGVYDTFEYLFIKRISEVGDVVEAMNSRTEFLESFANLLNLVIGPIGAFREAWASMFPETTGGKAEMMDNLVKKFAAFTESIQPSTEALSYLSFIFKELLTIGKNVFTIFKQIVKVIVPVEKPMRRLMMMLLKATAYTAAFIETITTMAAEANLIESTINGIRLALQTLVEVLKMGVTIVVGGVVGGIVLLVTTIDKLVKRGKDLIKGSKTIQKILKTISTVVDKLRGSVAKLLTPVEKVTTHTKKMQTYMAQAGTDTAEFGTIVRETGRKVDQTVRPMDVLIRKVKLFGETVKLVATVIGAAVVTGVTKIGSIIRSAILKVKNIFSSSENFKEFFHGIIDSIISKFEEVKEKLRDLFENLGIDFSGIKDTFKTVTDSVVAFTKSLDTGKIVAIAISIALLALVTSLLDTSKRFGEAALSIKNLTITINTMLKAVTTKTTGYVNMAKSIALIAGSLALLTYVDQGKLLRVSAIIAGFMVLIVGLSAALTWLATKLGDKQVNRGFRVLTKNVFELAAAMAILAGASILLSKVKFGSWEDVFKSITMMIGMMTVLVGSTIAISHLVKKLPKSALTMLTLALSMGMLANAMAKFAELPTLATGTIPSFLAFIVAISTFLAAAGKIKISGALGLLIFAKALNIAYPALKNVLVPIANGIADMAKSLPTALNSDAAQLVAAVIIVSEIMITLTRISAMIIQPSVGKLSRLASLKSKIKSAFTGLGVALASMGAGLYLATQAIKTIADLCQSNYNGMLMGIGVITLILFEMVGFAVILQQFHDGVNKSLNLDGSLANDMSSMGIMMAGLGVSVLLIAKSIQIIAKSGASPGSIIAAGAVIGGLVIFLSIFAEKASAIKKGLPIMGAMIAVVTAIGVIIGELAVLMLLFEKVRWQDEVQYLGALVTIVGSLIALTWSISKLPEVKTGAIWGMVGMIAAIGAVLISIALIGKSDPALLKKTICDTILIVVSLVVLSATISKIEFTKTGPLVAMIGMLVVMAGSLVVLAQFPWDNIRHAMIVFGGAIAALVTALVVLNDFGGNSGDMLAAAGAIAAISASMILVAAAMKIMDGVSWKGIIVAGVALAALVGALFALSALCNNPVVVAGIGTIALAFISLAGSLLAFGVAAVAFGAAAKLFVSAIGSLVNIFREMQNLDGDKILGASSAIADGLIQLGYAGTSAALGVIGIAAMAGALALLGLALPVIADGMNYFVENNEGLAETVNTITLLGLAFQGIALLSPGMIVAAAALLSVGAGLYVLGAGSQVAADNLSNLNTALGEFAKVWDWMVDKFNAVKEKFIADVKQLPIDIARALSNASGLTTIGRGAEAVGQAIAGDKNWRFGGILGTIATILGWHSPPQFILDLMDDIATAFGMNSSAESAASKSGAEIGNAYGKSIWETAKGWLGKLSSFSAIGTGFELFDKKAYEEGGKFEWLGNKFSKLTGKVKDSVASVGGPLDDIKKNADDFMSDIVDSTGVTEALDEMTEGFEDVGTAAGGAGSSVKDFKSSLLDTVEGQLDIFSKFETKTEVTAQTVIDNMRSNIEGFASWSHRMAVLAVRFADAGIDKGLYQKLAEMGPKGYETMNAFYQMSEEQLAEVRDLYATSLTIPKATADVVGDGFTYMGEVAVNGFSHALDEHMSAHLAAHGMADAAMDGMKEVLKITNGMSQTTKTMGDQTNTGMQKGIKDTEYKPKIAAYNAACGIKKVLETNLNKSLGISIGGDLMDGLAIGIGGSSNWQAGSPVVNDAAESVTKGAEETVRKTSKTRSPSTIYKGIGGWWSKSIAIGITDAASNVYNAAKSVTEGAITGMSAMTNLGDLINTSMDFNPVITPLLDLSYIKKQAGDIDGLLGGHKIGAGELAQNGGSNTPQQITFTQNNYSPKALSSVDIYRQTKNQIGVAKGVVSYA